MAPQRRQPIDVFHVRCALAKSSGCQECSPKIFLYRIFIHTVNKGGL